MKHYKILSLIFFSVFLTGLLFHPARGRGPASVWPQADLDKARALFPNAAGETYAALPVPHVRVTRRDSGTGKETVAGYAFRTTELAPDVRGYSGPIDLLVSVDSGGKITGILLLRSQETSSYIKDINAFLRQFINHKPGDPFVLGRDIDGISQATITSSAVTRAVKRSLALMAERVLPAGAESPAPEKNGAAGGTRPAFPSLQLVIPGLLFAAAFGGIFFKQKLFRRIALLGSLLYLGIRAGTLFAAVQIANIGLRNLPAFQTSPLWYAIIAGAVLSSLAFGMVYCGSICPFAAVQEILYKAGQKIFRKNFYPGERLDRPARYFKHLLLITTVAAALWTANPEIADVEVYVTLFSRHGTGLAWALLGVMLALALVHFRFWCKYFCPIGAFTGLLSRWSLMKIRIGDGCNACRRCLAVCPTQAILAPGAGGRPVIDGPECILCQECVRQCPQSAMSFRYAKNKSR